jgi:hypothetical protein
MRRLCCARARHTHLDPQRGLLPRAQRHAQALQSAVAPQQRQGVCIEAGGDHRGALRRRFQRRGAPLPQLGALRSSSLV